MNFISSASSLVGGEWSAGRASKAVLTLDKFFFRGSGQPAKQQGVSQPCCTKRQRTSCAAAATAKRTRTQSTQQHIAEYFSVSSTSSNSSRASTTEEQSQQDAASTEAQFCDSASGYPLHESDVSTNAAVETSGEQCCSSRLCLEEIQGQKLDREQVNENDQTHREESRDSKPRAVSVADSRFGKKTGGLRKKANVAAGRTATPECTLETEEKSSFDATRGEKTAPLTDDTVRTKTDSKEGREMFLHCGAEEATPLHDALRHAQRDTRETCSSPIEGPTASAAASRIAGHAATAIPSAFKPATLPSPASGTTLIGTLSAKGKATAAVSTFSLLTKRTSVAVSGSAKASFLRYVTTPVSGSPVPAVDPEGQYLADLSQLEQRWRSALGDRWFEELRDEIKLPYFANCLSFVRKERQRHRVFPPAHLLFNAFRSTPLDKIKVVIVGQDPYHQVGQAMGLAFSVPRGVPVPPSLQNIFKEIDRNYPARERLDITGKPLKAQHGDLTEWAKQGVLLMNTVLTVRENSPLSHKNAGWETFTNKVINIINTRCDGVVFLLWGKPAQKKSSALDRKRHLILEAGHPSPLSVRFFEGCQHFLKCNEYLLSKGKTQIVFTRCL